MTKDVLFEKLNSYKKEDINFISLFIKDQTLEKVHFFSYKKEDLDFIMSRLDEKYSNDLICGDKVIVDSMCAKDMDALIDYYNTLSNT